MSLARNSIFRLKNIPFRSHSLYRAQINTVGCSRRYIGTNSNGTFKKVVFRSFAALGALIAIPTTFLGLVLLYDFTTYGKEDLTLISNQDQTEILVNGGPKDLPIVNAFLADSDSEKHCQKQNKPRLVILGSGWGAVSILRRISTSDYHITVISPHNYFLFTPLLPAATVGTMEIKTLVEPMRRILRRVDGHFLEARAVDVEFGENLIEVVSESDSSGPNRFYVPYDRLIITVGAESNTHGVDGLEYCHFLKSIRDARRIRNTVLNNFERASLPNISQEERKRLLSFVVCGGGPTGVEFAAELWDMINEDLVNYFPKKLLGQISVHIIQSQDHILNTYDEAISSFAEQKFAKEQVDVQVNSRVQRVTPEKVEFSQLSSSGEIVSKEIPAGMVLWSTGNAMNGFAQKVCEKLGDNQTNKHAIETDTHLRVLGVRNKNVYAIGDCSTVQNNMASYITTSLISLKRNHYGEQGNSLSFKEFKALVWQLRREFPQAAEHLKRLDRLFLQYDQDRSGNIDYEELYDMLSTIDSKLTSLPATAQRASSQGKYLAQKLNKLSRLHEEYVLENTDLEIAHCQPYVYKHLLSAAYIGNSAVFDIQGKGWFGGIVFMYLWRSVYLSEAISLRTKVLFVMDWIKRGVFGRDVSRI